MNTTTTQATTSDEIETLISETMNEIESHSFELRVEGLEDAGWANPILEAQNQNQGYDSGIRTGTFADALNDLVKYGEDETDQFDEEEWELTEEYTIDDAKSDHLLKRLSNSGKIGEGEPLVYIGVEGYYTLICSGASREEIREAVTTCYGDQSESE